jgi:sulfatase modifying factor 1
MSSVRRPLAFGLAAIVGVFVACSSFEDGDEVGSDAGAGDAPSSPGDATAPDANAPADAGPQDAEAGPPAGMILVTTAATSFWIDTHEVTTKQFTAFKETVLQTDGGDAGFPAICAFKNGTLGPQNVCAARQPGVPVACVDWCDAYAYCKFAGKRLCGRIGGGASMGNQEAKNPLVSEWMRACTGGNAANAWPYGAAGDGGACNTLERDAGGPIDAGALPGCVGGEQGLFDMSGNVAELIDACGAGTMGVSDGCTSLGGSYAQAVGTARCSDDISFNRGTTSPQVGFRCCKDP